MDNIKNIDDFLNEKFDHNETYFKLMPVEHFVKVVKNGYLSPMGKVTRTDKKNSTLFRGNWTIPYSNIEEWLVPVKYFGSPLQALLMKPAAREGKLVLLRLKITKENEIHNRDITKMFVKPTFKGYYSSFSSEEEYRINETFIGGKIYDFKVINVFDTPKKLSEYVAEPESILYFLHLRKEIKYTDKKMTPISQAMLRVILKKIFTFDFKNF